MILKCPERNISINIHKQKLTQAKLRIYLPSQNYRPGLLYQAVVVSRFTRKSWILQDLLRFTGSKPSPA